MNSSSDIFDFFRIYRIEDSYESLYKFIRQIRSKVDWPEALNLFKTEKEIMTAINQVATHF